MDFGLLTSRDRSLQLRLFSILLRFPKQKVGSRVPVLSLRRSIHLFATLLNDCAQVLIEELRWHDVHVLHVLNQLPHELILLLVGEVIEHT